MAEEKKNEGIKMHPKIRWNQTSSKSYEIQKHLRTYKTPDTLKNFYFDNFNSEKENQIDRAKNKSNVSLIIFYLYF